MDWVIPEKIHTPTKARFFDPTFPPEFRKLLEPPSPQDLQDQRPPPPPPTHMGFHKIVRHRNFNLHSM